MDDVVSRVQVDYVSTGADQMAANYERVARAEANLARQAAASAGVTDTLTRSTLSAQRALDSYTRSHDPLTRAMEAAARGDRLAAQARAQGIEVTEAQTRAMENARKRVDELKDQLDRNTSSTKLNSAQAAELTHVAKSLFDEIAAGASPFRALTLEGGRIGQVFAEGKGGVSGTFKALAGTVGGLLNPTVLLTGAVVGLGAAGAATFLAYESGQAKLVTALDGTGRAAGATLDRLNQVGAAGAKAGNLSTSEGLSLAAGYTRAGFTPDLTQSLIGSTKAYARFAGTDVDEAGQRLAAGLRDPNKGAADLLGEGFGALNGRLQTTIADLTAQGRLDEARLVTAEALNKQLAQTTDTAWGLSKAFEDGKNWVSNLGHSVGSGINSMFFGDSPQDEIKRLQGTLARTQNSWFGNPDAVKAEIDRLQGIVDAEARRDQQAAQAKRDQDANRMSLQADAIVRGVLPDLVKQQETTNSLAVLRQAMNDPNIMSRMGVGAADAQRAYGDLAVQSKYSDATRTMIDDNKLALASIDAVSVAERAAVESRRAELAVLRESGDVRKAALAAEIARNQVIAKANSDAEDRLTKAKEDAAMVGLTPAERQLQAIRNKYEGDGGILAKDAASGADMKAAMQPVVRDIDSAAQAVADALHRGAATIGGAVGPYGTLGSFGSGSGAGALARAPASVFPMISDAADRTGIPASVIAAIGERENGFKLTGATGILGADGRPASTAWGYGQLTNGAARDVAAAVPGFDKFNPSTAVFGSAEYLSILQKRNGGDLSAALNAYGGSPGYAADILRRAGSGLTVGSGTTVAPIASTAYENDLKAYASERNTAQRSLFRDPLDAANRSLDDQDRLFGQQRATAGLDPSQIEAAAEKQKLLNQYASQHITLTKAETDAVDAYGTRVAAVLQQQADFEANQQRMIAGMDGLRSSSREALGTFVDDLVRGRGAGQAFADVLGQVSQKALGMAENGLIDGLLGKSGTTGGGLLGGSGLTSLLGSLFGGIGHNAAGTEDWKGGETWVGERGPEIVNLPAHAQVIPAGQAAYGAVQASGRSGREQSPVVVNFNVKAPTPEAFHASRNQISGMLGKAVARGQRNA